MKDEVLRLVDRRWPDPFYATPRVVWEEYMDTISADAFLLYHIYRYHANSNTGKCWPSISKIAKRLGWGWRRVKNARNELEAVGLISVKSREKGRVAVVTMLRPKPLSQGHRSAPEQGEEPLSQGHTPMPQGQRPMPQGHTNNTKQQEYMNNNTSQYCLSLLLSLLDREAMSHEIKKAKEFVQHCTEERILDVVDWARTREKPFGAAVHALEGGYPVRGPQWLPPIQRPKKKGEQ